MAEHTPPTLPTLVQRFFLDHLGEQRAVSSQTVAAYRDTLRLLLNYAAAALRRTPSAIEVTWGKWSTRKVSFSGAFSI